MNELLQSPLYWHWIVGGIILIISELMLASFFIIWFGAAAIIIGIALFFFPAFSPTYQILTWTILSSVLAWAWFKYLKPLSIDKTKAGLSAEAIIGEIGQVLSVPVNEKEKRGVLRFPAPILGADEWLFICEDKVEIGDRVKVQNISGNSLIVKKV